MVSNTLARNFANVYLADLDKKTACILKLDAAYVDVPGKTDHHEFPFDAVVAHWIDTIVYPDDREKLREVITAENVKQVFQTKDEMVGNYRSVVDGELHHFQYSLSKVDEAGTKAILGFQNVDDIVDEHLSAMRREKEKEVALQDALTVAHYDYGGRHVLLVEDNELNREIATAILEEAGITADTAADGTEAVDIIHKAPEDKYDLVFMDIQMPKMDGYMATREIRALQNSKKANIPMSP